MRASRHAPRPRQPLIWGLIKVSNALLQDEIVSLTSTPGEHVVVGFEIQEIHTQLDGRLVDLLFWGIMSAWKVSSDQSGQ
jgi:hypothetical protein